MPALYNEILDFPSRWLTNLAGAGYIAPGDVVCADIRSLTPERLNAYKQCHFFAGLGGWSHALRLAGWPDDVPVWTGSCPCQPFSTAGKQKGFDDERHLWPDWFKLIRECRPPVIFGEQVASPDGLKWLDAVSADLEDAGYAFGAADLCAAGVGAPHIRQRLYFVAYSRAAVGVALGDTDCARPQGWNATSRDGADQRPVGQAGVVGGLGNSNDHDLGRDTGTAHREEAASERERGTYRAHGDGAAAPGVVDSGATRGFWHPADWVPCLDGKTRPVEPGSCPLAHGVPGRVGLLRAFGNAIVPQVATTFIEAFVQAVTEP